MENHYFQAERSPEIDEQFDQNLERLMKYHEHIFWKFEDKLKPNETEAETMAESNEETNHSALLGNERRTMSREGRLMAGKVRRSAAAGPAPSPAAVKA